MLVFWILPLDTVFVKLKNRILGGNSTSWFKKYRKNGVCGVLGKINNLV